RQRRDGRGGGGAVGPAVVYPRRARVDVPPALGPYHLVQDVVYQVVRAPAALGLGVELGLTDQGQDADALDVDRLLPGRGYQVHVVEQAPEQVVELAAGVRSDGDLARGLHARVKLAVLVEGRVPAVQIEKLQLGVRRRNRRQGSGVVPAVAEAELVLGDD